MSTTETPKATAGAENDDASGTAGTAESAGAPAVVTAARKADRGAIAIAAGLLLACAGLVGYGILNTQDEPKPRAVPTAEVTYEVQGEGTVEISYLSRNEDGDATVESGVELPWKKTVQVPLGKDPSVNIVLGPKGGRAGCTLAIQGEHVQRATAYGKFGRATCTGTLPAPAPTNESTN
ncbi:MmpS family transport accessory protein [Streptomyces sp. NPDC056352]|uniref:MmpS family transport accessory protein n=1 Tax=Streptomyces sp. NPDC056352 TaxID=3345791 RepID=UPI0035D5A8A2